MKLREVNLQSLLNKLKSFSYTEVVNGTETTVNVSLYPDSQNEAMYLLFKQKVGNLKADDVLSDLIREEITDDELANVIKTQCIERWKQLLKVWQADYNPLWNVDGTEVRVIETEYGKQIDLEKGTTVTNEQIEDGKSVTEQKTKAVSTDYVSAYDSNGQSFNPAAKNETDAGKMEGTSSLGKIKETTGAGKVKDTTNAGKTEVSNEGTDTTTESGSDTVTDTFTRGGNIGTVSTVKLITEELGLWRSFNFYDFYFKSIADVISIPVWEV
jgi:hypothetical protein